ncbi:MAG: peptide deformylase [Gammaproteobacteria bacterium]|nr:MAG: peptide deformylase [Gammaproteobacteria bacterium]
MAIRHVLHYPDRRLRTVAKPVDNIDDTIRTLVDDMAETMHDAPGIGLAATQIDVHLRVIIIDISENHDLLNVFINPEIVSREGEETMEEGCLSVPGIFGSVTRAKRVRVRAQNRDGETFELDAEGLLAVCIQHEIDHLDGKVFVDYLSRLKQQRIQKKLEKQQRVAM